MKTRWTPAEDERLLDLASRGFPYDIVADALDRTHVSVMQRARILGAATRRRPLNRHELAVLAAGVRDGTPFDDLATTLHRSRGAVQVRASILGLTPRKERA